MRLKLHHLLLLSILVINNTFTGATQEKYDLSEFLTTGLEQNFSLQIARNRQEIAENNHTLGNAGFLPVLDLSARQSGTVNSNWQNFADGTTASASNIHNTTTNVGLNLGWNIFSGFRVQTTWARLEEMKAQGEMSTRLAIERFIAQTASEYYNYIQQVRQLHNLEFTVELSRERFRIDEERYLIGSGSRLQMMQSRVFLNADSSRLSRQHEAVRASQIRLNELIGSEDFDLLIGARDTMIVVDKDLVYQDLFDRTLDDNTSLLLAESDVLISEYDRKIVESRSYPYVNFTSGYGYTFNTYQAGNMDYQQNLGFNYGVTVGINIFDGYNRRRQVSNALIEEDNRRLQHRQIEQEVKADLLTIYKAYENNLRLLDMEYVNLETARENMDIALERYMLGELSGIELREVQKSLLEAEERLLSIQYQTKLAEISLLQISGRIMEYI